MASAVSHPVVEILVFLLLMQHAVRISTEHHVEQAKAAEERLGRASQSEKKGQTDARRGKPVQGNVRIAARPHLECAPGGSLWTHMRPLCEDSS